jgi:hypothetical protein
MRFISFILFVHFTCLARAQSGQTEYKMILDGQEVMVIVKNGDTTIVAELEKATVNPTLELENAEDRERWLKYQRYAPIVYPYAVNAVRIYIQLQKATEGQSEKEKRKFVKSISHALEDEFETPLKNLTRTQGFLLTKMLERQLHKPFYEIIKELKGGFSAFYWNQLGKFNGFHLKDQYEFGKDKLLDTILEQYDLTKDLGDYAQ